MTENAQIKEMTEHAQKYNMISGRARLHSLQSLCNYILSMHCMLSTKTLWRGGGGSFLLGSRSGWEAALLSGQIGGGGADRRRHEVVRRRRGRTAPATADLALTHVGLLEGWSVRRWGVVLGRAGQPWAAGADSSAGGGWRLRGRSLMINWRPLISYPTAGKSNDQR